MANLLSVFATDHKAEEGRSTASLTFVRDTTIGTETCSFVLSGSAVEGVDYETVGSTVTFADGQDCVTLLINPLTDSVIESTESIICTLDTGAGFDVGVATAEVLLCEAGYADGGYIAPLAETLLLNSKPDAEHTVYLNFFGGIFEYHPTGQDLTVLKFDKDGDSSTFSEAELLEVQQIWAGIAEDFAPFDLNITTELPDPGALVNSSLEDDTWGVSLLIGEEITLNQFAWSGSEFYLDVDLPGYINTKSSDGWWDVELLAAGGSHEIAHTMGLDHDGPGNGGYYVGHATNAGHWNPIMGQSNKGITQWSNGDYPNATNLQDDLAVITSDVNGIDYIVDDHAGSMAFATEMAVLDDAYGSLFAQGIISETADVDWFTFDHAGGDLILNVEVADFSPNLHAGAWLYDASVQEIGAYGSTSSLSVAIIEEGLSSGRYYLKVDGIGNTSGTGYSDYGSLGHYTVSTGSAVLAQYMPNGESTSTDLSGYSQLSGVTVDNLSSHGFSYSSNYSDSWALDWAGSDTLNLDQYITFTVSPNAADKALVAETLKASFYSYVSGTSNFVLRSSVDSFATDLDVQSITGSYNAELLTFDLSSLGQISSTTEFRIYVQGGGAGNRYLTGDGWAYDEKGQGLSLEGRLVDVVTINENNNAATGTVVITGTLQEDAVLTADTSPIDDTDGLGTFVYQWRADNVALIGETSNTLRLDQQHVGKQISVDVSFRDPLGTLEKLSSDPTASIDNINDAATGNITIFGLPNVGETLVADASGVVDEDGIKLGTLSYQWLRGGVDIEGATATSYTLTSQDLDASVTVRVLFDDNYANTETVKASQTLSVKAALPALQQLVNYDPDFQNADVAISASTVSADVTVSDLVSANHFGSGADNVWALYWNCASFDPTEYIGFTVTPDSGKDFVAENLTASIYSQMSGTTSFVLRSSLDNFDSDVATASISGTASVLNFDLSSLGLVGDQVELRLYAVGGGEGYRKLVGSDFSSTDSNEGLSLYGRIINESAPSALEPTGTFSRFKDHVLSIFSDDSASVSNSVSNAATALALSNTPYIDDQSQSGLTI
jgi:hypothetical protein